MPMILQNWCLIVYAHYCTGYYFMVTQIVILCIFTIYFRHIWHVYSFSPQQGVTVLITLENSHDSGVECGGALWIGEGM